MEYKFKVNNRNIILISTLHDKRDINIDRLKSLLDLSNKEKVCYLLETDYRKNKTDIRKKFGDQTSTQFMNFLLREEKNSKIKKCVKGWDVRQSILTQNNQSFLYQFFYDLSFRELYYYKEKIHELKINNKNNTKIINYINFNYNHVKTSNLKSLEIFLIDIQNKIMAYRNDKNYINNFSNAYKLNDKKKQELIKFYNNDYKLQKIKDIMKYYPDSQKSIEIVRNILYQTFAQFADLFLLEHFIFDKKRNTTDIVFMGKAHFDNIIQHIKLMKNNSLL